MDAIPVELVRKIIELAAPGGTIDYLDDALWSEDVFNTCQWTLEETPNYSQSPPPLRRQQTHEHRIVPHSSDRRNAGSPRVQMPITMFVRRVMESTPTIMVSNPLRDISRNILMFFHIRQRLILTCKLWCQIASPLLYRTLILRTRSSFIPLFNVLQRYPERQGWVHGLFIRRAISLLHPGRRPEFLPGIDLSTDDLRAIVIPLIRLLPNIHAFHYRAWKSQLSDVLCYNMLIAMRSNQDIRFLTAYLPSNVFPHIAGLDLSSLVTLSLTNKGSSSLYVPIQSAPPSSLLLPSLRSLTVRFPSVTLARLISKWSIPRLTHLSFAFDASAALQNTMESLLVILQQFGSRLQSLDLLSSRLQRWIIVDMAAILLACPNLVSLSFDVDLAFIPATQSVSHERLERIGLSGRIMFIKQMKTSLPVPWEFQSRGEDIANNVSDNVARLSRLNFPRLRCIRALSPELLRVYVEQGGRPAVDESVSSGFLRLERQCIEDAIELEDCTGSPFGQPPHFL